MGIDPSAATMPDTMFNPATSPASLPALLPRLAICFSAWDVSALTGMSAFAFCKSFNSDLMLRSRLCASRT